MYDINQDFSLIGEDFKRFVEENESEKLFTNFTPFPKSELTEEKRFKRIKSAIADYWFFDKTYFPPEVYENYCAPNRMLKDIVKFAAKPGYQIFLGPRKHGKTPTGKKYTLWLLLTGKIKIAGVYAETLTKSANILMDIASLALFNSKLMYDFKPYFSQLNGNQFCFRLKLPSKYYSTFTSLKGHKYCASFSEGRSVRGYTQMFYRPEFLLGDDIETNESSFQKSSVQDRISKLAEAFQSLTDNGTFLILGNDFDTRSALHQLRIQSDEGLISDSFNFHIYQAWEEKKKRPLWQERYPVESEAELKVRLKPKDEADWKANFQTNPVPALGFFFISEHYQEYTTLPPRVRGVLYCDPNLSKKGKGDTTAIVALVYSPTTDYYYILDAACVSFADSNLLLHRVYSMKQTYPDKILRIGFDGHVAQESTWSQLIKDYSAIHGVPFGAIHYKRYLVDELAKNLQIIYADKKLFFPAGFKHTPEGELFLSQFYSFSGKKEGNKDDAPDALICAFEFIHELHLIKKETQEIIPIKDFYSLL